MTPASVVPAGMPFTKGHGTENDFVLVADPDARLTLTAETVARLCDRRAGIGADGLIRVVRTAAMPATDGRDATDRTAGVTEWFMDYRNADGSLAQMCGNGVRVMAAFALAKGLLSHDELRAGVDIGTRAGVRRVSLRADGQYSVTMGSGRLVDPDAVRRMGQDTTVLPHASQRTGSICLGRPSWSRIQQTGPTWSSSSCRSPRSRSWDICGCGYTNGEAVRPARVERESVPVSWPRGN